MTLQSDIFFCRCIVLRALWIGKFSGAIFNKEERKSAKNTHSPDQNVFLVSMVSAKCRQYGGEIKYINTNNARRVTTHTHTICVSIAAVISVYDIWPDSSSKQTKPKEKKKHENKTNMRKEAKHRRKRDNERYTADAR